MSYVNKLVHLTEYGDFFQLPLPIDVPCWFFSMTETKRKLSTECCKENIKFIFKSKIHGQETSLLGCEVVAQGLLSNQHQVHYHEYHMRPHTVAENMKYEPKSGVKDVPSVTLKASGFVWGKRLYVSKLVQLSGITQMLSNAIVDWCACWLFSMAEAQTLPMNDVKRIWKDTVSCWFSSLLRGFFAGFSSFPPSSKTIIPNSNSIWCVPSISKPCRHAWSLTR